MDWNNYIREVCVISLLKRQQQKIGHGKIVKVDENMFTKRKKIRSRFYHNSELLEEFAVKQMNVSFVKISNYPLSVMLKAIKENIEK